MNGILCVASLLVYVMLLLQTHVTAFCVSVKWSFLLFSKKFKRKRTWDQTWYDITPVTFLHKSRSKHTVPATCACAFACERTCLHTLTKYTSKAFDMKVRQGGAHWLLRLCKGSNPKNLGMDPLLGLE